MFCTMEFGFLETMYSILKMNNTKIGAFSMEIWLGCDIFFLEKNKIADACKGDIATLAVTQAP